MEPTLPPVEELIGSWTLIVGEVKTGKTGLLAQVMAEIAALEPGRMALIDMAPEVTRGVGGKLPSPPGASLRICSPEIIPPRLTGKTPEDVLSLAQENAARLDVAFEGYLAAPAKILFINDVSLYLQAGDPAKLYEVLEATPTVVMNGYLGVSLGGGEMGDRERRLTEELAARCATVLRLG